MATIINGQGIAENTELVSQIATYNSNGVANLIATIYTSANTANTSFSLSSITANINQGYFLLDQYPPNTSPAVSSSITWTKKLTVPVGTLITYGGQLYQTIGDVYDTDTFANVANSVQTPNFSTVITSQANGPFSYGLAGFANTFTVCYGYVLSSIDTAGSLQILQNKTYADTGVGFSNITDLITGGVGANAPLLANVVSGFGTMYDITQMNIMADPYVFGQNLLNQNLGSYGNLAEKLAATGLNINDLTIMPSSTTVTAPTQATVAVPTTFGAIDLPSVVDVVINTNVTGNNPDTIIAIYQTITGRDLQSIISATGFVVKTPITSLADFLDFSKVIDLSLQPQLSAIGINSFNEFATYLHTRVGQKDYTAWSSLATYLSGIHVPVLNYTNTTSATSILSSSTISTLKNTIGSGSGAFGNPILIDLLGASAGIPYVDEYKIINGNISSFVGPVISGLNAINSAFIANTDPSVAINSLTSTINSLSGLSFRACETAYYKMINQVSTEVTNLNNAGAIFGPVPIGASKFLAGFGQNIGNYGGTDRTGAGTDIYIGKLITNNAAGDTIRAAIAENNNGMSFQNNPNPQQALAQSQAQGITLTQYLAQNK
jgi:hypothetical protein